MPTSRPPALAYAAALTAAVVASLACACAATTAHTVKDLGTESEYSAKFTEESRAFMLALSDDADPFVKVTFRTLGTLTPERKAAIEATEVNVDSTFGDVSTGVSRARALLALAELDYVAYIEIAPPADP